MGSSGARETTWQAGEVYFGEAAGWLGPNASDGRVARFFYAHELPKVVPQLDLLARLDRTTLDGNPACF